MAYPDPFAGRYPSQTQNQDDDARSAAAVVKGRRLSNGYVPYQDSPYYNGNGDCGSYRDSNSNEDPWDRYYNGRDPYHRYTKETIRHRRYNGTDSTASAGLDREGKPDLNRPVETANNRIQHEGMHDEERVPYMDGGGGRDDRDNRGRSRPRKTELERRGRSRRRSDSSSRSSGRSRRRSRTRSTSRPPRYRPPKVDPRKDPYKPPEGYTLLKAAKSAAMAGGVEAVRCRLEPGGWKGQKAQRVAIAAAVGVAIGSLRNGRLLSSGKKPYAEAAMTGFYAIDFLKRVARHTEFDQTAKKEQREWREAQDGDEDENNDDIDRRRDEKGGRDDDRGRTRSCGSRQR